MEIELDLGFPTQPQNLLLGSKDNLKVSDFGLSALRKVATWSTFTGCLKQLFSLCILVFPFLIIGAFKTTPNPLPSYLSASVRLSEWERVVWISMVLFGFWTCGEKEKRGNDGVNKNIVSKFILFPQQKYFHKSKNQTKCLPCDGLSMMHWSWLKQKINAARVDYNLYKKWKKHR